MNGGRLNGKTALVTGAAQGIGEGIARRLAAEGCVVVIADIDLDRASKTAADIRSAGGTAEAVHVDIGSDQSVAAMARAMETRFQGCDILVNNAAILDMTPFESLTTAHLEKVLNINLMGAARCAIAIAPLMRRKKWGRILNIASIMGVRGSRDSLPYSTAKGGVVNMTRGLACDLAKDGIVVNAIAPGFIDTRMALLPDGSGHEHDTDWFKDIYLKYGRIPLGRAGLPDDIAGPAYFFCSEDCRYVTGQILLVDGGVSATF